MNKPLFNFVKTLVFVFVLFLGGGDVLAQENPQSIYSVNPNEQLPTSIYTPNPNQQLPTSIYTPNTNEQLPPSVYLPAGINQNTPTQQQGILDQASTAFMEWAAPEGSILAALFPTTKNCNYVKEKLYQPFSAIDKTFPGAESLGFIEVNNRDTKTGGKVTCIRVASGTEGLLKILFTLLISIIIILSVINISVSGIQ
jgi:hypothetical protein